MRTVVLILAADDFAFNQIYDNHFDPVDITCAVFAVLSTAGTQIAQALVAAGPSVKVAIECPLFPKPVVKPRNDDPPAERVTRFKLTKDVVNRKQCLVLRESILVGGSKRVSVKHVRVGSEAYVLGIRKMMPFACL